MDGLHVVSGTLANVELREALRAEFTQLQQNLIEELRLELEKAGFSRERDQHRQGGMNRAGIVSKKIQKMRGFLPLRTYKVKQYEKWLLNGEQDDNLDVDIDITDSVRLDVDDGDSSFVTEDAKDAGQISPESHQVRLMEHDDHLPDTPMPLHPLSPDHGLDRDDSIDGRSRRRSVTRSESVVSNPGSKGRVTPAPSPTERAMGLGPRSKTVQLSDNKTLTQERCAQLVRSIRFEGVVMLMVILSALHIGWQTDYMARHVLADVPVGFRVLDILFMTFFTFELCLRLFAFRRAFFVMWGWGWNILDCVLVVMQVLEEIAHVVVTSEGVQAALSTSIILKILRILRFVRVIRVLHVMRFADELRLLVSCIVHSAKAFCWSTALLLLILYVMAVNLVALTLSERLDVPGFAKEKDVMRLTHWYGSVPRAVLSLFQGLTGGLDWNELVEPFMDLNGWWIGVVFFFYMAFVILAVMNVVTATFVEQAIERAAKVKEVQKVSHASRLFRSIDTDHSGVITYSEIASHLESKAVKDFFKSIDVDVTEAQWLFELLDHDNSGELEFGEFLTGCLRLQGPAKSIDLVLVMRELKEALRR